MLILVFETSLPPSVVRYSTKLRSKNISNVLQPSFMKSKRWDALLSSSRMGVVCLVVGVRLYQRCHGNLHAPSNNGRRRLPPYKLLFTTLQESFFPLSKAEASFLYNRGWGERKRKWRGGRKRLMYGGSLKLKF